MGRFDVYRNAGAGAARVPFLLEVQSDLLEDLDSRVVVPLRDVASFPSVTLPARLMPVFEIEGRACLMETPKLAAVPRGLLKERVASLGADQQKALDALDFLFQGY